MTYFPVKVRPDGNTTNLSATFTRPLIQNESMCISFSILCGWVKFKENVSLRIYIEIFDKDRCAFLILSSSISFPVEKTNITFHMVQLFERNSSSLPLTFTRWTFWKIVSTACVWRVYDILIFSWRKNVMNEPRDTRQSLKQI